jgi:hypothetical protein
MIDVYVRHVKTEDRVREWMYEVSCARWVAEGVKIHTVTGGDIGGVRERIEKSAESDPYIVTDDDCLIVGKEWVRRAVGLVLANPTYAIVSTLSLIEGENLAVPTNGDDIYRMHAVGQPMLIRKGFCRELPEMDLNSECGVLHKMVLDKGYQMGLIHPKHKIRHNHMGHGFSGNPALRWGI